MERVDEIPDRCAYRWQAHGECTASPIGEIGIADCARPVTISQTRLGRVRGHLSAEQSTAVIAALVSMLNVAHLINGTVPPQPAQPTAG